jgi:Domain of unknown function (DUF4136)
MTNTPRTILLIGILAAAPALAQKPQIQWNQDYDFQNIHTFAWKPSAGENLAQADPFLHAHIINTIEFQLTNSGLTEVESNPDVLVTYYASSETQLRLQSDSYGYGWGGYGRGGWGYYGYGVGGPISTTTRVVEYERGTLVVDIVDARSSELVWRGLVSGIVVTEDPRKMQKNVTKAIEKMVKQSRKLRARAQRG